MHFVREFKSKPSMLFTSETQIRHLEDFNCVILPLAHNSGNWKIKAQESYQCGIVDLKPKWSWGGT